MLRPPLLHSSVGSHHSRPRSIVAKFEERPGKPYLLRRKAWIMAETANALPITGWDGTPRKDFGGKAPPSSESHPPPPYHHTYYTTINTSFSLFCCIMIALIIMDNKKSTSSSPFFILFTNCIRYVG